MRWIDRGPDPAEIAGYGQQYTQGWIDYYNGKDLTGRHTLPEPEDHEWSYYSETLGKQSVKNCWYCERRCQAVGGWALTVDHFRPRSRFPESTYAWSNWIFSCKRCNSDYKRDKWPESGYVDPCATDFAERPEHYFDYDLDSGRIIAQSGLSDTANRKAWDTINDLGLSEIDLVNPRFFSIRQFIEGLTGELLEYSSEARQAFIDNFLDLSPAGRVEFLISSASTDEQSVEYPGLKAMAAEKLFRENHP